MYVRISDPGMASYPPRVVIALRTQVGGFHAVRGGIHPGEHRFRPRLVGIVGAWKDFRHGHRTLSYPSGAGSTNPRLGFPYRAGRYRPGRPPFSSPVGCIFEMYGRISDPGMGPVGAVSTKSRLEFYIGVLHHAGRYGPGGSPPFRLRFVGAVDVL